MQRGQELGCTLQFLLVAFHRVGRLLQEFNHICMRCLLVCQSLGVTTALACRICHHAFVLLLI